MASVCQAAATDIYAQTLHQCHGDERDIRLQRLHQVLDQEWSGRDEAVYLESLQETMAAESFDVHILAELYHNKGLSDSLITKLQSPDYERALRACFPEDPLARFLFTADEIKSDLSGKVMGTAITGLTFAMGGRAFSLIKQSLSPVAQRVLLAAAIDWSSYRALNTLRATLVDASPQEKQQMNQYIADRTRQPDQLVMETRLLVQQRIRDLETQLTDPTLSLQQRTQKLQQIQNLQKSLAEIS